MLYLKMLTLACVLSFPVFSRAGDYILNDYDTSEPELLEQAIDSGDPCTVTLCMFGKATGNSGGSECSGPEKKFFKIIKKKKGSFQPGKTLDARKAFISQCDTAGKDVIDKIISKFGKVKL